MDYVDVAYGILITITHKVTYEASADITRNTLHTQVTARFSTASQERELFTSLLDLNQPALGGL